MVPLLITMGCPAGIGPEVVVKALAAHPHWWEEGLVEVVGDRAILERAMEVTGAALPLAPQGGEGPGLVVDEVTRLDPREVPLGRATAATGRASYLYIRRAIERCLAGEAGGMATGPINKAGLRMAGVEFPGHTEILAHFSGVERYAMMFAGPRLRLVLVTIHEPLAAVPGLITEERVFQAMELFHRSLVEDFAIPDPMIGVAGLNPHAGEGGLFGHEEERAIAPAVERARALGWRVEGPLPPDTIFPRAVRGELDGVVCHYHDQGLIPFKLIHFEDGVNCTLGLPFVRTSVDHGTAYDIAGTGAADPSSMVAAVELGLSMVRNRARREG